jgi:hypothetical protein
MRAGRRTRASRFFRSIASWHKVRSHRKVELDVILVVAAPFALDAPTAVLKTQWQKFVRCKTQQDADAILAFVSFFGQAVEVVAHLCPAAFSRLVFDKRVEATSLRCMRF